MPHVPPLDAIREFRYRTGKLYERPRRDDDPLGHQRWQYQGSVKSLHVPSSVRAWKRGDPITWDDPDIAWRETLTDYREGNAYFRIRVPKDAIGYRYESRTEGFPFVQVRLTHLDGVPVTAVPTPERRGHELWWMDVVPGVDIFLRLTSDKADLRKRIRTAGAPRSFRWAVRHADPLHLRLQTVSVGQDNFDRLESGRLLMGPGRCRRTVELTHVEGPRDTSTPGEVRYRLDETWTGRTFEIPDPSTRVKVPVSNFVLPIEIDVLVEEEIAADADDGFEDNSLWNNSYAASSNGLVDSAGTPDRRPAFRFTSVAIPNAATIDDATFAVESVTGNVNANCDVRGSDEDNAAAITDTHGPTDFTGTTAVISAVEWVVGDATDVSLDVQAIVAEITSRGGWATGQDMIPVYGEAVTQNYAYLEDEADADPGAGRLTVNYTAVGGNPKGPLGMPLNRPLRGPL